MNHKTYLWMFRPPPAGAGTWFDRIQHWQGRHDAYAVPDPKLFNIGFVNRGRLLLESRHATTWVEEGQLFCNWARQPFDLVAKEKVEFYRCRLRGRGVRNYLHALGLTKDNCVTTPSSSAAVSKLFAQMFKHYSQAEKRDPYQAVCQVYELVRLAGPKKPPARARDQTTAELVEQARSTMQAMLDMPLKVDALAQTLHVSVATLLRAFKRVAQETPIQMLTRFRIEEARRLLTRTDLKMTAIADACGFQSEKYFYRCFKKAMGETPGAHRLANTSRPETARE